MHLEPFDKEPKHKDNLKQGDVLHFHPRLKEAILNEHHGYCDNKPDIKYLIILTQRCDLIRHSSGCKAELITIAPLFSLAKFLRDRVSAWQTTRLTAAHNLCSRSYRPYLESIISSLLNNQQADYFFVGRNDDFDVTDDVVAYLNLWVSIAVTHNNYKFCQKSRCASLTDVFRAKLGRLVGDIYSRVGTPDWIDKIGKEPFEAKVSETVDSPCTWTDETALAVLEREQRDHEAESGDKSVISEEEVLDLLEKRSRLRDARTGEIVEIILSALSGIADLDHAKETELRHRLLSSEDLARQI